MLIDNRDDVCGSEFAAWQTRNDSRIQGVTMFRSNLTNCLVMLISMVSVGASAQAGEDFLAQLETKKESAAAEGAFVEEFDGDELSSQWQPVNPLADSFIVEDGALLVVSGAFGTLGDDTIANLFKSTLTPPEGDWSASIRVTLEAQTGKEEFYLLIHDDAQHYVGVGLYTWFECCGYNAVANVVAVKRSGDQNVKFDRRVWTSETASSVFSESARSMPSFLLRLEKRGHSFYPAIRLEGPGDAGWIELERLVALRAKGRIAFALRQYEEVKGESIATIDWVRVEPLP